MSEWYIDTCICYAKFNIADFSLACKLLWQTRGITPDCVFHCHWSPPCQTLNTADHDISQHFVDSKLHSDLAVYHMHCFSTVLGTKSRCTHLAVLPF